MRWNEQTVVSSWDLVVGSGQSGGAAADRKLRETSDQTPGNQLSSANYKLPTTNLSRGRA